MNEEIYNHHYIIIDNQNRIVDFWSDGPNPTKDIANAICINDRGGYQFRLSPGGEENPPMYDEDGISLYKWDGHQVISRTEQEIETDRAAIPAQPPSFIEQLRADVDFVAALQGVIL